MSALPGIKNAWLSDGLLPFSVQCNRTEWKVMKSLTRTEVYSLKYIKSFMFFSASWQFYFLTATTLKVFLSQRNVAISWCECKLHFPFTPTDTLADFFCLFCFFCNRTCRRGWRTSSAGWKCNCEEITDWKAGAQSGNKTLCLVSSQVLTGWNVFKNVKVLCLMLELHGILLCNSVFKAIW